MSIINERIKQRRIELGLTLLEVATALGVKEPTAQRYESGEIKNIKYETIEALSNILNCHPCYLMGWEEMPKCKKEVREVKEFVNVSPLALTVARKFDNAPLKEKNMVLMTLDLELLKEDTETNSISSVS
ncbi:MAG: helix-turn-helix transcriptional regulator [Firmicutes bacterium]|jgi:transcriptional regulator with XRE-family HTH domain|nr:helix-turn-helix transcriptional regulator [Bacillota bacterium]